MAAESVTFHNVPEHAYRSVRERLLTILEGSEPDGEQGVIEFHGVRGKLRYDAGAQTVTATFHHVPRLISRGYVTGWLHDALSAASG
ncbi:MAG TPA: hypothetical protein VFQ44_27330 [Streptosporangiaceae bacterium]|nr:hypothetical protein [Streptosporangiaceae bacterium]